MVIYYQIIVVSDYLTKILDTLKLSLSDNYNVIVKTNDYYDNLAPHFFKNILIHVK